MRLRRSMQGMDFYRKIERDLTKGTVTGAVLSIIGAITMLTLFLLEFNDYMTSRVLSQVQMDDFEDELLQINFNVTVEHITCPFLSIDTENVLGTHKLNLTRNIRKWKVKTKGRLQRVLTESNAEHGRSVKLQEIVPLSEAHHAKPNALDELTYEPFIKHHDIVMINFYAPWCMWSKRMLPVWTHTAQAMKERFGDRVGIAQVDCTANDLVELCHRNHVVAFPTIIVFKGGNSQSHEQYHGDRTTEAFLHHAEWELPKIDQEPEHEGERELLQEELNDLRDGDGKHTPAVEGCQVTGSIKVKKVPGSLMITALSPQHSFDPSLVNLTHIVHHLSFGQRFWGNEIKLLPKQVAEAMHRVDNHEYISLHENQTHEHYIKVVGTTFKYLDVGHLSTYKYTLHSAAYHATTLMPVVKFQFDLSPMNVLVTETFKPFYQFATSMFAIIGGVFTVFGLLDSFVHNAGSYIRTKLD